MGGLPDGGLAGSTGWKPCRMAVLTDAGLAKQRNLLKLWGLPALQVRVLVPGQLYSGWIQAERVPTSSSAVDLSLLTG